MKSNMVDMIGIRVGTLTVISKYDVQNRRVRWLCKCDCGEEVVRTGTELRRTRTTARCPKCRGKEHEDYAFNKVWSTYLHHARTRNLNIVITKEEFKALTIKKCHYCGSEPSQISKSAKGEYIYNGVDRKDSSKDYTIDNVVPCCGTCNTLKMALGYEEFFNHIERILKYHGRI